MKITIDFPDTLKTELAMIASEHNFATIEDMLKDWLKGVVIVDRKNKAQKQAIETAAAQAKEEMSSVIIKNKRLFMTDDYIL